MSKLNTILTAGKRLEEGTSTSLREGNAGEKSDSNRVLTGEIKIHNILSYTTSSNWPGK